MQKIPFDLKTMIVWEEFASDTISASNPHGDMQRIIDAMRAAYTSPDITAEEWIAFTLDELQEMREAA
jgi:hypothetical protein